MVTEKFRVGRTALADLTSTHSDCTDFIKIKLSSAGSNNEASESLVGSIDARKAEIFLGWRCSLVCPQVPAPGPARLEA